LTTTAAVYERDGAISVRDVTIDPLDDDELLVRITACGICPGEAMDWYMARKAPIVLGHEPVGIVEECGRGAGPFGPGERVFVHHHAPCMQCRSCARGDYVQCATWRERGLNPGGMSQRAVVSAPAVRCDVLPLPDGVDDDRATFIEPLATVLKSIRRAGLRNGDRVLVLGLGVMGLLHVLVARSHGAQQVIGTDYVGSRRAKATQIGADAAFHPDEIVQDVRAETSGEGADVVFVGPGSIAAMETAAACVARGGKILLFTPLPPDERWAIPVHDFYFREVDVITSYSAGPEETREALLLLESGLPVETLITHRFGLRDTKAAYDLVAAAGEALKVIVYPNR
jgi:L-iditol 2-dehydrogenase